MGIKPKLNADAAKRAMAEKDPKYSPQEALIEAERCLYCFDAPCIMSCPTGIDIPSFIKKIADGNLTGSARTILESNVLGASCARVCPTEVLCEGACVMLDREQAPVQIGRLQRFATDHVYDNDIQVLKAGAVKSGKRVALIGGGPASLGCAAELVRLGHDAVIFEKKEHAGGLNTYGMAYYKMPPEVSLQEVEMIKALGVTIKTRCEVGKDISIDELQHDYDAIFVGVGLGDTYSLGIPGEDLPEVVEALRFIEDIHTKPLHEIPVGKRVAVIGCGNTAIDAVTQAKRLGAEEAVIVYRRGPDDMPAYAYEYDIAKKDGCSFMFHTLPVEVIGDGHVEALMLARTRVNDQGRVEMIEGSEFEEPFDMVIKALGQQTQTAMLRKLFPNLELTRNGTIVKDASGKTSLPAVFCGGDEVNGGAEAVNAVGDGKKAARGIHEMFCGESVEGPIQTTRYGVAKPTGSGLDKPVRVPELEAEYYRKH